MHVEMASSEEPSCCESDPNFAIICAFLEKFGVTCGLNNIDFLELQAMLENTQEVPQMLVDLHIKLLRKARKSVSNERWEKAIIKFCHTFCSQDAWEFERFGYKKARISSKLRVLKELLELQFDSNGKFKTEINKMTAQDLRSQPLGKDKSGHSYWFQSDENYQIRVYKEDLDEETWTLVAKDRDGLVTLINELGGSDGDSKLSSEDSNSLSEKPIIDTGQITNSSENSKKSLDEEEEDSNDLKLESKSSDDKEENPPKKLKIEVSQPIEDPVVKVCGNGSGVDNKAVPPIVSEEIVEDVFYVFGNGNGNDCETGNTGGENNNDGKSDESNSNNLQSSSISEDGKLVDKVPFKLGTIIDTKTDGKLTSPNKSPTKKSRWDQKGAEDVSETDAAQPNLDENNVKTPPKDATNNKPMFFFGRGCFPFKSPTVSTSLASFGMSSSSTTAKIEDNNETDNCHQISEKKETDEVKKKNDEADNCQKHSEKKDKDEVVNINKDITTEEVKEKKKSEKHEIASKAPKKRPVDVENKISTDPKEKKKSEEHETVSKTPNKSSVHIENKIPTDLKETKKTEGHETVSKTSNKSPVDIENKIPTDLKEKKKSDELETVSKISNKSPVDIENKISTDLKENEKSEEHEIVSKTPNKSPVDTENKIPTDLKERKKSEEHEIVSKTSNKSPIDIENKLSTDLKSQESTSDKICEPNIIAKDTIFDKNEKLNATPKTQHKSSETKSTLQIDKNVSVDADIHKSQSSKNIPKLSGTTEIIDNSKETTISTQKSQKEKEANKNPKVPILQTSNKVEIDNKKPEGSSTEIHDNKSSKNKTQNESDVKQKDSSLTESTLDLSSKPKLNVKSEEGIKNIKSVVSKDKAEKEDKSNISKIEIEKQKTIESEKPKESIEKEKVPPNQLTETNISAEKVKSSSTETDANIPVEEPICTKKSAYVCGSKDLELQVKENTDASKNLNVQTEEKLKCDQKSPNKVTVTIVDIVPSTKQASNESITVSPVQISSSVDNKNTGPSTDTKNDSTKDIKSDSIEDKSRSLKTAEPLPKEQTSDPIVSETGQDKSTNNIKINKDEGKYEDSFKTWLKNTETVSKDLKSNENKKLEDINKKTSPKDEKPTQEVQSKKEKQKSDKTVTEIQLKAEKSKSGSKDHEERTECKEGSNIENIELENFSNDTVSKEEKDPLEVSDKEIEENENISKPMSLQTFSMDFHESSESTPPPIITRALRKRTRDNIELEEKNDELDKKKMKLKGKRPVDQQLRKSVEEKKDLICISSDDDDVEAIEIEDEDENDDEKEKSKAQSTRKGKRGKFKKGKKSTGEEISDELKTPKKKADPAQKNKRLLANLGITSEQQIESITSPGVRQSRRLAQLKIKEITENKRNLPIVTHSSQSMEKKLKKAKKEEKRKRKKEDSDASVVEIDDDDDEEEDEDAKKKKKRKKHKDPRKIFDEKKPWKSSSDDSSSEEGGEEEEEYEEEDEPLVFKSDHEFSPESDMENDEDWQPTKRARTARKESDVEEEVDDCNCQKCGKSDHPEWILLCDKCDNGWHCSCLRPPLLVIPEGDWFCPPCQHFLLLEGLKEKLVEYDKKLSKKEIEDRRKERLAYVGISLNNVLPSKANEPKKKRGSAGHEDMSSGDTSESNSESEGESESDSDEPIYQLRQRKRAQSYKFNDYDEMIKSAIQDEMEAVKGAGNQGRGKDIANIVNAEREEDETKVAVDSTVEPKADEAKAENQEEPIEEKPVYSDDEPIKVRKLIGKKKHRKLNSLDISSSDDGDSDEDFKGSDSMESEDEFVEEDLDSEDSDDDVVRRNRRGKSFGPVRRSTRARVSRYDADFINDDTDDEGEPQRKKKRSIWDESEESEESDRSWGRRKRNKSKVGAVSSKKKQSKKKKKKKRNSDSDVEYKKKPRIKYGGLESSEEEGSRRTRTRGKKTTYVDTLGSDTDEDLRRNKNKFSSDEDEDFVANEDEEVEEDDKISEEDEEEEDEDVVAPVKKNKNDKKPVIKDDDDEDDNNEEEMTTTIEQINKNLEEMDENEMEKMMEEEEYANKQLKMVALQLEKEKKRKEREKINQTEQKSNVVRAEVPPAIPQTQSNIPDPVLSATPVTTSAQILPTEVPLMNYLPPQPAPNQPNAMLSNISTLIHNEEGNDELSEPPGVSLPLFSEIVTNPAEERKPRKRRIKFTAKKKNVEETSMNLSGKDDVPKTNPSQVGNIEIAAPPQPFSSNQPAPSVITRMLQNKPPTSFPVIRAKSFISPSESLPAGLPPTEMPLFRPQFQHNYPVIQRPPMRGPPPNMPPNMYNRSLDPSPSGGGPINMSTDINRGRFPHPSSAPLRAINMMRPPYPAPPPGFYNQYPDVIVPPPSTVGEPGSFYEYSGPEGPPPPSATAVVAAEGGKYDEESGGGEFGGLVSYFSSQREDDLES